MKMRGRELFDGFFCRGRGWGGVESGCELGAFSVGLVVIRVELFFFSWVVSFLFSFRI